VRHHRRGPTEVCCVPPQAIEPDPRRVQQQDQRLAVLDRAGLGRLQGCVQRQLERLDVLALGDVAATDAGPVTRLVFGGEEVPLLGHRARAQAGLEQLARPSERQISSCGSRPMQASASSPSSRPTQASTSIPSAQTLT
jgi:hypothetical protein